MAIQDLRKLANAMVIGRMYFVTNNNDNMSRRKWVNAAMLDSGKHSNMRPFYRTYGIDWLQTASAAVMEHFLSTSNAYENAVDAIHRYGCKHWNKEELPLSIADLPPKVLKRVDAVTSINDVKRKRGTRSQLERVTVKTRGASTLVFNNVRTNERGYTLDYADINYDSNLLTGIYRRLLDIDFPKPLIYDYTIERNVPKLYPLKPKFTLTNYFDTVNNLTASTRYTRDRRILGKVLLEEPLLHVGDIPQVHRAIEEEYKRLADDIKYGTDKSSITFFMALIQNPETVILHYNARV